MFGRRRTEPPADPLLDLVAIIDEHGWAVRHVFSADGRPPFSYTVGLTRLGRSEVVMTGLPHEPAQSFLDLAGDLAVAGSPLAAGTWTSELADGCLLPVIAVDDVSGLTAVLDLFGAVDAVQVVWSDGAGRFPWDVAFANPPGSQPLLGRSPAPRPDP